MSSEGYTDLGNELSGQLIRYNEPANKEIFEGLKGIICGQLLSRPQYVDAI
jgi:hypothetical protein